MRVLVAEDEPVIRDALGLVLRTEGYEVTVAADGVEALERFGEDAPDAVLLDLLMPRMDGLETCRRIRTTGSTVPIVLITAVDGPAERAAARTAGINEYVVKPFEFAEVLSLLRDLLSGRDGSAEVALLPDLAIDPATGQASTASGRVGLSALEMRILTALIGAPGWSMPAESLVSSVWGYDFGGGSRLLDPYLRSLNAKLARLGGDYAVEPDGSSRTLGRRTTESGRSRPATASHGRPATEARTGQVPAMAAEFTGRTGDQRGTVA